MMKDKEVIIEQTLIEEEKEVSMRSGDIDEDGTDSFGSKYAGMSEPPDDEDP